MAAKIQKLSFSPLERRECRIDIRNNNKPFIVTLQHNNTPKGRNETEPKNKTKQMIKKGNKNNAAYVLKHFI